MIAARLSPGAISESSSSHLPPIEASRVAKPVTFPLGRSSRGTMPVATGSITPAKTIGIVRVEGSGLRGPACQDDVGLQADQLLRGRSYPIDVIAGITNVHPHVAPNGPAQVRKRLSECGEARLPHGIVFVERHERADAPHAVALLRSCRERPCRRAAESGDECSSCNGGGHLPAPVLKPKANDTMIGMVVSSGSHNSIHWPYVRTGSRPCANPGEIDDGRGTRFLRGAALSRLRADPAYTTR